MLELQEAGIALWVYINRLCLTRLILQRLKWQILNRLKFQLEPSALAWDRETKAEDTGRKQNNPETHLELILEKFRTFKASARFYLLVGSTVIQ